MAGYAFIAPALICYLLLVAFPFCLTLILSFTEFNFLKVRDIARLGDYIEWIGLENFVNAFRDRRFMASVSNTFVYAIATVPASIFLGLFLAYVLNGRIFMKKLLRLAFFIPYISSVVAVGADVQIPLSGGWHCQRPASEHRWRRSPLRVDARFTKIRSSARDLTSLGYVLMSTWRAAKTCRDLYEAATIDGATGLQQFGYHAAPRLAYDVLLVIVRLIAVFKIFGSVNVFTMGSTSPQIPPWWKSFHGVFNYQHGYASAAVLLLIIMFSLRR
ncbi:MAG: carbohydrate ABC transporter permease [Merdibacter sp.]